MKKNEELSEWMRFAESAFELAKKGKVSKKVTYEDLCFQAQQAAEKAIKGVLFFYGIPFPKTHKIEFLFQIFAKNSIEIPKIIEKAKILSDYASDTRYPGNYDPVTNSEYKEVLKISSLVLNGQNQLLKKNTINYFKTCPKPSTSR